VRGEKVSRGMGDVVRRWSEACGRVRSAMLRGRWDVVPEAFGLLLPGCWRGESTYAPIRAGLLQKLLGPSWYAHIYDDKRALWLLPEEFSKWQVDPQVRRAVQENLALFCRRYVALASQHLSALGWARLVQAAADFELYDLLPELVAAAIKCNPTPDAQALVLLAY
jgi:hypothetical protein